MNFEEESGDFNVLEELFILSWDCPGTKFFRTSPEQDSFRTFLVLPSVICPKAWDNVPKTISIGLNLDDLGV